MKQSISLKCHPNPHQSHCEWVVSLNAPYNPEITMTVAGASHTYPRVQHTESQSWTSSCTCESLACRWADACWPGSHSPPSLYVMDRTSGGPSACHPVQILLEIEEAGQRTSNLIYQASMLVCECRIKSASCTNKANSVNISWPTNVVEGGATRWRDLEQTRIDERSEGGGRLVFGHGVSFWLRLRDCKHLQVRHSTFCSINVSWGNRCLFQSTTKRCLY